MIFSDIKVDCPNCHISVRCPFLPYDFDGNFVSQSWDLPCPKCGYPLHVDTRDIEALWDKG